MIITCLETDNSQMGQFVIVYALAAWPKGTRRNRGWDNARTVYEREASPEEFAEQQASPRFLCYRYQDWQGVKNDEALYGFDADHVRDDWRRKLLAS